MKKNLRKILFFIIILVQVFIFGIDTEVVFAEDSTTIFSSDEVQAELNDLYNYINNMKSDVELMNELDPISYVKAYMEDGKGNISLSKIVGAVVSLLFKEVKTVLGLSFSIIVIGIISALLKNLQEAFNSEGISEVAFYACYALMIVILTKTFLISLDLAKDVISGVILGNSLFKIPPIIKFSKATIFIQVPTDRFI